MSQQPQTAPTARSLPETPSISPFMRSFQSEMNALLDHFRGGEHWPGFHIANGPTFPALDIAETEDAVEITAEVPGVEEENLDATVSGDVLTLKGEKSGGREESDKNYHLVERHSGSFLRQIPLGFTPDENAVEASFSDGVLKLVIKKPDVAKTTARKIKISKT